jgi:hypothetical protein
MPSLDQLVLEDQVRGSLQETLVLRGAAGRVKVIVLFSSEILDHWPADIQAARLNEMHSFLLAATRRKLAERQFSMVEGLFEVEGEACLIVLGWKDIAS